MVDMYVTAIKYGWMEFESVPDHLKTQVAEKIGNR
ncbi:CD1375 family protein [Jeotgalibacillus marinus]|uniref:CD1375 family protein n=1 Tax=Jeotgalibacillus marinus TaxID=86667 RepID=A0ABV3Q953_9BACL